MRIHKNSLVLEYLNIGFRDPYSTAHLHTSICDKIYWDIHHDYISYHYKNNNEEFDTNTVVVLTVTVMVLVLTILILS